MNHPASRIATHLRTLPRLLIAAPPLFAEGAHVALDAAAAAHARAVRVRPGNLLRVFSAGGPEWVAYMEEGGATVSLSSQMRSPPAARRGGIALFAPPLERARMSFLVEKATELGVRFIVPTVSFRAELDATQRSRRAEEEDANGPQVSAEEASFAAALAAETDPRSKRPLLRVPHSAMRAWARGATEQSARLTLPTIGVPLRLNEALEIVYSPFFAADQPPVVLVADETLGGTGALTVRQAVDILQKDLHVGPGSGFVCVFIGPEGGWNDSERQRFRSLEWHSRGKLERVSLGRNILRAETAAITAVAALADLGYEMN